MNQGAENQGTVSQLVYYPVKSLAGISLDQAVLTPRGIEHDRMWMLVRDSGAFITQREEHRLALLNVAALDNGFQVSTPTGDKTWLPIQADSALEATVRVWKDALKAVVGPPHAREFFSDFLGYSCQAVFLPEQAGRMARELAPVGTPLSFADAYPGLLTSDASLSDLNVRSSIPIGMRRFRPNIVVSGVAAYAEDGWSRIDMGEAAIACVKPCARCVLTTVDPDSGTAGKEPLATLAAYRRVKNDVYFGQNFVVSRPGTVRLGDSIKVMQRKPLLVPGY